MKANFYTESVLYWLAKRVSALAQKLPPEWNVRIGAAAGAGLYYAVPARQDVALDNLRSAFGGLYTPAQYRRMVRAVFENLGAMFMEVAAIPSIDRHYVERWLVPSSGSRERLEDALAKGKGVILLTGHFGNWELISIAGALHGYPTLVLAREQGWPKLNRMLTEYRQSKGCRVVTKGFPVRELIQGLKEGRIIGILADQDGGRNGILSPFFGRLASTAPGTIALSFSTGAPVLPVFLVRIKGPMHRLIVEEPLEIPQEGTVEERLRAGVAAYLERLEEYVRRTPAQWLWMHRRWKSSPERKILIFSDGKAGHDSQALALAQRLDVAWRQRASEDKRLEGILTPWVTVSTVQVQFRHPGFRLLLNLAAAVLPRRWMNGDLWLRLALSPESYRKFRSDHAHISISCGSATAAVNLLWARQIRCKAVHILKVGFPSWRRFDLSVIPRHDIRNERLPKGVIVTDGSLAPRREVSSEQAADWSRLLKLSPGKRKIGLLLGGPAGRVRLDRSEVERAVDGLLSAAERLDAELLATTSRRTPPQTEMWLLERLAEHPRCRLLVLVNRRRSGPLPDTSAAIPCILELSDVLVVSGDSISMVSEAVATSKPVVSFPPEPPGTKHHRFLRQMDERGRLHLVQAGRVGQGAMDALNRLGSGTGVPDPGVPGTERAILEFLRQWL